MSLKKTVYRILLVSSSTSFNTALSDLIPQGSYEPIKIAESTAEGKRLILEQSFDFIIINAPLSDESGIRFAIECCRLQNSVILLLVKNELYSEVYEKVSPHGVFTLQKPLSRLTFNLALSWMVSARERLRNLQKKSLSVEERMEEIKIINRAKWLLISELKLTEPEAHHYIEKKAMDDCISKKEAAQNIIKIYS